MSHRLVDVPGRVEEVREIVDGFLVQVSRLSRLETPFTSKEWDDAITSLMESLSSIEGGGP